MRFFQSAAIAASLTASLFAISPASAATAVVTDVSGPPTATTWGTIATENTGSAVVSTTAARNGNGSLEMRGDRVRAQVGIQYAPFRTNLGALSDVTALTFDWRIAGDSTNGLNPDYTPALRLLVQDGNQRSELIWEGVYNNTYGNTKRDTWYSSGDNDNFYQFVAGSGVTLNNGSQVNKSLTSWISSNYSSNAFVSGFSVGVGSSASSAYRAFADNVTLTTAAGSTTYNFEAAPIAGAVPEPATWAMMLVGFGGIGFAMRRRKSKVTTNVAFA